MPRRYLRLFAVVMFAAGCAAPEVEPTSTAVSTPTAHPTSTAVGNPTPYPVGSVPAVLAADERFDTFLTLLEQTETVIGGREGVSVVAFMSNPMWVNTLFAPTNQAFEALPEDEIDELWNNEKTRLSLLYRHIAERRQTLAEFTSGTIFTLAGATEVRVNGETVIVGGAKIIEADIVGGGAIIHVVDALVQPQAP